VLRMSLLGEQTLIDDRAGSVQVRSSRAVALVAFLALHAGSPQSRQRIAGLLWPDSTDAQALTNLRRELHHLRQVLGDEASLVVTPKDLCWRDTTTYRVDVRVFAAAAFDNPDYVAVIIDNYRWRLDLVPGDPRYAAIKKKLDSAPTIAVPTITVDGKYDPFTLPETARSTARISPASTTTGRSMSVTTCRRKRRRPSPRPSSTRIVSELPEADVPAADEADQLAVRGGDG
jgi:hypothetical protein